MTFGIELIMEVVKIMALIAPILLFFLCILVDKSISWHSLSYALVVFNLKHICDHGATAIFVFPSPNLLITINRGWGKKLTSYIVLNINDHDKENKKNKKWA